MTTEITLRLERVASLANLTEHSTDCVAAWLQRNDDGTYGLILEEPKTVSGLRDLRSRYLGIPNGPKLRTEDEWCKYKESL